MPSYLKFFTVIKSRTHFLSCYLVTVILLIPHASGVPNLTDVKLNIKVDSNQIIECAVTNMGSKEIFYQAIPKFDVLAFHLFDIEGNLIPLAAEWPPNFTFHEGSKRWNRIQPKATEIFKVSLTELYGDRWVAGNDLVVQWFPELDLSDPNFERGGILTTSVMLTQTPNRNQKGLKAFVASGDIRKMTAPQTEPSIWNSPGKLAGLILGIGVTIGVAFWSLKRAAQPEHS